MEFEYLKNFYELVLAQSGRKLSEINNIPVSKISRQLSALERELGHTLLERKQGVAGIKLTRQGKVLYDALPGILGAFNSTKMMMDSDPSLNKGEVTIYTTTSLIEDWFVNILPFLFETYPSIHINLISHDTIMTDEMQTSVISISPKRNDPREDIIQVPLLDFHVGLWASSEYLDRFGRPQSLADLRRHRLFVFAKELDKMFYPNMDWHLRDLDIKQEDLWCIHSSSARIKAANKGLGIISLSEEAIKASGYTLERVLPNVKGPTVTMCFTYPYYFKDNKIIKNIEDFLKDQFPKQLKKMNKN